MEKVIIILFYVCYGTKYGVANSVFLVSPVFVLAASHLLKRPLHTVRSSWILRRLFLKTKLVTFIGSRISMLYCIETSSTTCSLAS